LGLRASLSVNGFHLCILFTMLVSGILFVCPNRSPADSTVNINRKKLQTLKAKSRVVGPSFKL
jgi:hypothetical protein